MQIIEETEKDGVYTVKAVTASGARMVASGTDLEETRARALYAEPEPA